MSKSKLAIVRIKKSTMCSTLVTVKSQTFKKFTGKSLAIVKKKKKKRELIQMQNWEKKKKTEL